MSFVCKKCEKIFRDNYDLQRHINKGKRCVKNKNKIIIKSVIPVKIVDKNFSCKYCGNRFTRKDSLKRHIIKSCKILHNKDQNNKMKDEQAEEEWNKLSSELENIGINCSKIDGKKYIQHNNHINIIKNEIHNHYTPAPYSESKKDHITDRRKRITLNNLFTGLPKLLKDIHGDLDKPENLNLYMPNKREPYVKVFNGENWTMELLSSRLKYIVVDFIDMTDDYINEMGENIPYYNLQKYESEKKACLAYCKSDDTDNTDVSRMIELFKLTMYNFKDLIDETNLKIKSLHDFIENYEESKNKKQVAIENMFQDESNLNMESNTDSDLKIPDR